MSAPHSTLPNSPSRPDCLLVVPPFMRLDIASLGVHSIQATAKAAGYQVSIIYANQLFAEEIGESLYGALVYTGGDVPMLGERVFAHAAHGIAHLGSDAEPLKEHLQKVELPDGTHFELDHETLMALSLRASDFCLRLAQRLLESQPRSIGCTAMINQLVGSMAILKAVRQLSAETCTILGGPSCDGPMGEGVASASSFVDYVFSGESERSFVAFLDALSQNKLGPPGVIEAERIDDLDTLPAPDFSEYFAQLDATQLTLHGLEPHLPYEASRGCWWGQKHHCSFCGVSDMTYRMKSPDTVLADLRQLLPAQRSQRVSFADNILPHRYFDELFPRMGKEFPGLSLFFECKANLSLAHIGQMLAGGAWGFLPGLEALSTSLLKRANKGITARQNLATLRYAKAHELYVGWYLLYGFPGDSAADYAHYGELLPLIAHLCPPRVLQPVEIIRFSPYGTRPDNYEIENLRPSHEYSTFTPPGTNLDKLAFLFDAEYDSIVSSAPQLVAELKTLFRNWRDAWTTQGKPVPKLHVHALGEDSYLLEDTRELVGVEPAQMLNRRQAQTALVSVPLAWVEANPHAWSLDWAQHHKLGIEIDEYWVPLATAVPEVLSALEAAAKREHRARDRKAPGKLLPVLRTPVQAGGQ